MAGQQRPHGSRRATATARQVAVATRTGASVHRHGRPRVHAAAHGADGQGGRAPRQQQRIPAAATDANAKEGCNGGVGGRSHRQGGDKRQWRRRRRGAAPLGAWCPHGRPSGAHARIQGLKSDRCRGL